MTERHPDTPTTDLGADFDPDAVDLTHPSEAAEAAVLPTDVEPRLVAVRGLRGEIEQGDLSRSERSARRREATDLVVEDNIDAYANTVPGPSGNVRLVNKGGAWVAIPVNPAHKRRDPEPDMLPDTVVEKVATNLAAGKLRKEANLRTGELFRKKQVWGEDVGTDDFKPKGISGRLAHRRAKKIRGYSDRIAGKFGTETKPPEDEMSLEGALEIAGVDKSFNGLARRARQAGIPVIPESITLPPISATLTGRERETAEQTRRLEITAMRKRQFDARKAAVDRLRGDLNDEQRKALARLEQEFDPIEIVLKPIDPATLTDEQRAELRNTEEARLAQEAVYTRHRAQIRQLSRQQWAQQQIPDLTPRPSRDGRRRSRDDDDDSYDNEGQTDDSNQQEFTWNNPQLAAAFPHIMNRENLEKLDDQIVARIRAELAKVGTVTKEQRIDLNQRVRAAYVESYLQQGGAPDDALDELRQEVSDMQDDIFRVRQDLARRKRGRQQGNRGPRRSR